MKKLLALLGIGVSMYISYDIGCLTGTMATCKSHHGIPVEKKYMKFISVVEEYLMKAGKTKSSKKRSDILHEHAVMLAEQGYTAEEIKNSLENLRKELD